MDAQVFGQERERRKDRENNTRYLQYARDYIAIHRERLDDKARETADLMARAILTSKQPERMALVLGGFIDTEMHFGTYGEVTK